MTSNAKRIVMSLELLSGIGLAYLLFATVRGFNTSILEWIVVGLISVAALFGELRRRKSDSALEAVNG